jgi:hypothetical protein
MANGKWAKGALATKGGFGRPTSCTPFFFRVVAQFPNQLRKGYEMADKTAEVW